MIVRSGSLQRSPHYYVGGSQFLEGGATFISSSGGAVASAVTLLKRMWRAMWWLYPLSR